MLPSHPGQLSEQRNEVYARIWAQLDYRGAERLHSGAHARAELHQLPDLPGTGPIQAGHGVRHLHVAAGLQAGPPGDGLRQPERPSRRRHA